MPGFFFSIRGITGKSTFPPSAAASDLTSGGSIPAADAQPSGRNVEGFSFREEIEDPTFPIGRTHRKERFKDTFRWMLQKTLFFALTLFEKFHKRCGT